MNFFSPLHFFIWWFFWLNKYQDLSHLNCPIDIFSILYKPSITSLSQTVQCCGGGGGSRTRVLRSFHADFYKFSRKLYVFSGGFGIRPPHSGTPPEVSLKWWRTTSTEPGLDHTLNHVLGQPGWARPHQSGSESCAGGSVVCVVCS